MFYSAEKKWPTVCRSIFEYVRENILCRWYLYSWLWPTNVTSFGRHGLVDFMPWCFLPQKPHASCPYTHVQEPKYLKETTIYLISTVNNLSLERFFFINFPLHIIFLQLQIRHVKHLFLDTKSLYHSQSL